MLQHYAGLYEVRIHLPEGKNGKLEQTPTHIKCKVAAGRYRITHLQYGTRSPKAAPCSSIRRTMDQAANGPDRVRQGDALVYLGIDSYGKAPLDVEEQVFLGDPSAVGHFFALMQLTNGLGRISGSIIVKENQQREAFEASFPSLSINTACSTEEIAAGPLLNGIYTEKQFYLAGNSIMVHSLRKLLKQQGVAAHRIHAQGFWK